MLEVSDAKIESALNLLNNAMLARDKGILNLWASKFRIDGGMGTGCEYSGRNLLERLEQNCGDILSMALHRL